MKKYHLENYIDNKKLEVLKFILKKILSQISPERIILFGSIATGNYKNDADIDIAIEPKGKRIGFLDIVGNVDIVNLKNTYGKLKKNILEKGIIIYEKGKILI